MSGRIEVRHSAAYRRSDRQPLEGRCVQRSCLMENMSTRLAQVYPQVAALFQSLPSQRQSEFVHQLALDALAAAGVAPPPAGSDLAEWADAQDSKGWTRDAEGEWRQDEGAFACARAAFALHQAADAGSRAGAAQESLYESIAALGIDVVREKLDSAG